MLIKDMADIYLDVIEADGVQSRDVLNASKALMDIMSRAEQIELLAGILRRVPDCDRDDALELICALLPYAKARPNAPRAEIAGVSMFNAVIRASKTRKRRTTRRCGAPA